jgi:predicted methyltransferase
MDLAEVVPTTQRHIHQAGLVDQISTRVGDTLRDPFGENYHLILVSAICHIFSAEENCTLFQHAYRALQPGGCFVIQDFILDPDKTPLVLPHCSR